MADWKDTCNLPRTAFSMKANLQTTEPETVARWEAMDLYGKIRGARRGAPKYLLHDGPPYANGEIHMGHALNKILKDLVVKSHNSSASTRRTSLLGYRPADRLKVEREIGPKRSDEHGGFPSRCRAYAEKYLTSAPRSRNRRARVMG